MVENKTVDEGPELEIIREIDDDLDTTEEGMTCRMCLVTVHNHIDFSQHLNGNQQLKTLRRQMEYLNLSNSRQGQTSNGNHWKSEKIRYSLGKCKQNRRQGGRTKNRSEGK